MCVLNSFEVFSAVEVVRFLVSHCVHQTEGIKQALMIANLLQSARWTFHLQTKHAKYVQ